MVIIIEEENILKIRKINEIRGYSANLNILEKIIIWTIIVILTLSINKFLSAIFVFFRNLPRVAARFNYFQNFFGREFSAQDVCR